MNLLFVGALAWNPERISALVSRGHRLYGLWARTMGWEQGPYAFASGVIEDLDIEAALNLLRDGKIDIIYSLFQVYDRKLWAPDPAPGVEDVWALLRRLLRERNRGTFNVPIVRHWGFDVHNLDLEVVRALDGQIFCNRQQLEFWTASAEDGGCGLDLGLDGQEIAFLDSDLPSRAFMGDDFTPKLSAADGEIHTVCIGRPLGIDFLETARNRIHVHVYGNNFDDVAATIAQDLSLRDLPHVQGLIADYLHVHRSIQPAGASLEAIRAAKNRWVAEFSRYDAGWSYVGRPLPWPRLEDRAAIPNRLGTYLLTGLPVIVQTQPGYYRYEAAAERGVAVDFSPDDYGALAARLRNRDELERMGETARRVRREYSFDATIEPLLAFFERATQRRRSPVALPAERTLPLAHFATAPSAFRLGFGSWRPQEAKRLFSLAAHRVRMRLRRTVSRVLLNDFVSWALQPAHAEGQAGAADVTPERTLVLERFPQPSRNCGDDDRAEVIRLGGDERLMKPDGRRRRGPELLRRAALPLRCLASTVRIGTDPKLSLRDKQRLTVAALGTRGGSWEALAGAHRAARLLRSGRFDQLECYTARGFPLVPMLSELSAVPYRELLSDGTRYFGEFAFELAVVVPYAYWLHRNGRLRRTEACADTRGLYYFSPGHTEVSVDRTYVPVSEYPSIPASSRRFDVHAFPEHLDASRWLPPPYRERFANSVFVWDKPLCIVCNKYTPEPSTRSNQPVNFISLPALTEMLEMLRARFQVVYVRPRPGDIVEDHQPIGDLGDFEAIRRRFPDVLTIQQIHAEHPELSFNELQLRLFANCDRFVSVLGGSSFLASYFGGKNVVFAREGWEVDCNAYENWFHRFSGAEVFHAEALADLVALVRREIAS